MREVHGENWTRREKNRGANLRLVEAFHRGDIQQLSADCDVEYAHRAPSGYCPSRHYISIAWNIEGTIVSGRWTSIFIELSDVS